MLVLTTQLDGSPFAGYNCNLAVLRSLIIFATGGRQQPVTAHLRDITIDPRTGLPDRSGGTTLAQMAIVAARYGVTMEVHYGIDFEQVWAWGQDPTIAMDLSIAYSVLHGTPFDADPHFSAQAESNHAVLFSDRQVGDPLADGRRGLPKGLATWSKDLLERAAGSLNVGSADNPRMLGVGKAYVGLVRAPKPDPAPVPKPKPKPTTFRYGGQARARGVYRLKKGIGVGLVRSAPNNTSRPIGSIPVGVVVTRLLEGQLLPFHVAQTTYSGASVGGDRRWHGDLTGKMWIHHSLVSTR
jgi:hypothetical protein